MVSSFNVSDAFIRVGRDVAGWQGARSVTECGYFGTVLGGYNQLGRSSFLRKTLTGLCTHNTIAIAFAFIAIDFWTEEEAFLFIDDVLVWRKSISNINVGDGGWQMLCGGRNESACVPGLSDPGGDPLASILNLYPAYLIASAESWNASQEGLWT
jgi:hypothetical protein